MRFNDLRQKEVINIRTCKCLGCIADAIIDCETGCLKYLIIPGPGKICSFLGRDTEYIIPWNCIRQIGDDIVLVEIDEEDLLKKCE